MLNLGMHGEQGELQKFSMTLPQSCGTTTEAQLAVTASHLKVAYVHDFLMQSLCHAQHCCQMPALLHGIRDGLACMLRNMSTCTHGVRMPANLGHVWQFTACGCQLCCRSATT